MDDSKRPKPKCVVARLRCSFFLCIVCFFNFFFFLKNTVLKKEEEEEGITFIWSFPWMDFAHLTKDRFYLCRVSTAHTVTVAASWASTVLSEVPRMAESHSNVDFLSVRFSCSRVGTHWMSPRPAQLSVFLSTYIPSVLFDCSWTVIVGLQ